MRPGVVIKNQFQISRKSSYQREDKRLQVNLKSRWVLVKSILRILIVHRAHTDSEKGHDHNGINPSVSLFHRPFLFQQAPIWALRLD